MIWKGRAMRGGMLWAAIGLVVGSPGLARGSEQAAEQEVITLWPKGAPGAKGTDPKQDVPTLTVYRPRPEAATGSAVVVCPGGGYAMLAMDHEGKQVAEWLNSLGITAFVLEYRLGPRYHHPAMLQDAGRAIRTVRAGAEKWKLDPHRIAILGFSAGGHLASTAGTHFRRGQARRRRPHRAGQLAAGPDDPGVSGHFAPAALRT